MTKTVIKYYDKYMAFHDINQEEQLQALITVDNMRKRGLPITDMRLWNPAAITEHSKAKNAKVSSLDKDKFYVVTHKDQEFITINEWDGQGIMEI